MQGTAAVPSGARRLDLKERRRQLACRYLESRQIEEFASTACTPFWRVCCVAHQWDTYTMSVTRGCSVKNGPQLIPRGRVEPASLRLPVARLRLVQDRPNVRRFA